MSEKLPRPSQVTIAGWLVLGGSLGALVTVYARLSTLHSLDTREGIERSLSEPPFDDLGIGVGTVLDTLHVLALITGACAAATVILGWHVLQRHRASRVALTILAVPLLLAGMSSGGFFSTLVAVAVALLWVPQARDWFDGVPARESAPPSTPPSTPPNPTPPPASDTSRADVPPAAPSPRAYDAFGTPQQPGPPAWPASPPAPAMTRPTRRPTALTWAAVLTWVLCALGVVALVLTGVAASADPRTVYDEMLRQNPELRGQGLTQDMAVAAIWVGVVLGIAACAFTAVVAYLTVRGHGWARVTLIALVAVAAGVLLLTTVFAPPAALGLAAAVVALALLLRPEVRAWTEGFRR